uniref:monocarboxylate transporter 12-like isoform X2 n=1 Tax=Ciona intestinalis TaxID=7719 RepID=UPI000EF50EA4|nr:monocarboxylate transporter 12-like isoform X2 [Ciona intestinalis]|eukprot:XP_026694794.1 monocarboxylate transporter 12-like isoform X2 [Ciona intestinalis]
MRHVMGHGDCLVFFIQVYVHICPSVIILGPLGSIVTARLGYRRGMVLGGVLQSCGFVLCAFAPTLVSLDIGLFITGFGCSIIYVGLISVVLGEVFQKNRSLVSAIITSSGSWYVAAYGPLNQMLIDHYGWKGSLLITAGVTLNIVPFSMLYISTYRSIMSETSKYTEEPQNISKSDDEPKPHGFLASIVHYSGIQTLNLYSATVAMATSFTSVIENCVSLILIKFALSIGYTHYEAVYLQTLYVIVTVVSKFIIGYITSINPNLQEEEPLLSDATSSTGYCTSKCPMVRRSYVFSAFALMYSLSVLIPIKPTKQSFVAYCVLAGISSGPLSSTGITVAADMFGRDAFQHIFGLRSMLLGINLIAVSVLDGYLIKLPGTFDNEQYLFCGLAALSAAGVFVTQILWIRNRH